MPGPACYGRGGDEPTITDCNLVLGYLSEDNFLGGRMRLDADKARARRRAAGRASRSAWASMDAAEGIVRIIDVKMEEAIKAISTMRGHDLRDFMLLAFGGAGPLHAGRIARDLGMAGVIVPLYPGVYSAIGLLMSDVKHDYVAVADDAAQRARSPAGRQRHVRSPRRAGDAPSCATTALPTDRDPRSSARSTCATPARATRSPCRCRATR